MTNISYPLDITQVLDVRVPIQVAYDLWQQVEQWPAFLQTLHGAHMLDAGRLRIRGDRGGQTMEWEAIVAEHLPPNIICWESTAEPTWRGEVKLEALDEALTRVTWHIYDAAPNPHIPWSVRTLQMIYRVAGDLRGFKQASESRYQQ